MPSNLPPFRRIVIAHDAQGNAIKQIDEHINPIRLGPPGDQDVSQGYVNFGTKGFPPKIDEGVDGASFVTLMPVVHKGGSKCHTIDLPPGGSSPMHRTESIDYVVVLHGELQMDMPSGETIIANAGELLVQQATTHQWHNRSSEWTRVLFVVLEAQPVKIDGKSPEGLTLD